MQRTLTLGVTLRVTLGIGLGLAATAGCRLDPLVEDTPGASASVLPAGTPVPLVGADSELSTQIALNDSLDPKVLGTTGIIPRGTGVAGNGAAVPFWAFGSAERAPAPIYIFGTGDPAVAGSFQRNEHLPLVDAVPGDSEYEPIHTIYQVAVTSRYHGELITTPAALRDAIDLGLVAPPLAIKQFVNWPIVRSGTHLEVGPSGAIVDPIHIYTHGHIADSYRLGGALGTQPNPFGLLPTSQVSFLRAQTEPAYNAARPIFQVSVPAAAPPPGSPPNYTPVSIVINVDLMPGVAANTITKDMDLFMRSPMTGAIIATLPTVLQFTVTDTSLDLQMQFEEGSP